MSKKLKYLVFGFTSLAIVLSLGLFVNKVGAGQIQGPPPSLTFGAGTVTSSGALTLTGDIYSDASFATTTTTGIVNIATGVTTGGINIGGSQDSTTALVLGGGTSTGNVDIGGTVTGQTINIGNLGGAKSINIGLATGGATLNLEAGTGRVNITGQIKTAGGGALTATESGVGIPTYTANSNATAGIITSSTTSHTTIITTFADTWTNAPFCVISPANVEAAVIVATGATGAWVSTTPTTMVINMSATATPSAWAYHCFAN